MSDFEAIFRAREAGIEQHIYADITNLPPGYIEGFRASLDIDYHVTLTGGATNVEGRQVTINDSHQIVDDDFVGNRMGPWFYYIYLDQAGDFKVDRVVPEFSDKYLYYAHPLFTWRALGKLWVDDADDNIKYVTNEVAVGASAFVTISAFDADEPIEADYVCTGTNDNILIQAATDFMAGAWGGGTLKFTRGQYNYTEDINLKANIFWEGEGISTHLYGVLATSSLIRIIATSIDNCGIRNMKFTVGSTNTAGVSITASNSSNVLIDKVVVVSAGVSGQKLRQGIAVGGTSANVKIQDCEVTNIGHATGSYGIAAYGTGTVVTGNNVHDCGTVALGGIYVSGSNCIITENNVDTCSGNGGIRVIGDKNMITSNTVQNCGVGILVDATADATTISGNDLDNNTFTITDNGTNTMIMASDNNSYFQGGAVGIGTIPTEKFHVLSTEDMAFFQGATANSRLMMTNSGATADKEGYALNARDSTNDGLILQAIKADKTFVRNIMMWLHDGNVGVATIAPTALFSVNEKAGVSSIGGHMIMLTNKTGGNTVAGQLVEVYTATAVDDAFKTAVASSDGVIGIVYEAGVADGSEAWIIVAGIADVLMDGGGSARGDRIISSGTAGSADVWNVGGAVATHFLEIGHCIETRTGAGLARCVLHFN